MGITNGSNVKVEILLLVRKKNQRSVLLKTDPKRRWGDVQHFE